jgi:molybdopterin-guanine dinucleotide biosynthesis protein A
VLLIGGASSRFGSPKALARIGGVTLAERTWSALAWCDERIAIGKVRDALPLPFPVLDDGVEEEHAPVFGVLAGLRAAAHDLCVVLRAGRASARRYDPAADAWRTALQSGDR